MIKGKMGRKRSRWRILWSFQFQLAWFKTTMITRYHPKRDDSFSSLPVELIHEIAEHLPVNDLLSFCLVCKEFHIISLRILYTNIQKPSRRCLNTLFSNVRTSQAVKTLALPAQTNTYVGWIGPSDVPCVLSLILSIKYTYQHQLSPRN